MVSSKSVAGHSWLRQAHRGCRSDLQWLGLPPPCFALHLSRVAKRRIGRQAQSLEDRWARRIHRPRRTVPPRRQALGDSTARGRRPSDERQRCGSWHGSRPSTPHRKRRARAYVRKQEPLNLRLLEAGVGIEEILANLAVSFPSISRAALRHAIGSCAMAARSEPDRRGKAPRDARVQDEDIASRRMP